MMRTPRAMPGAPSIFFAKVTPALTAKRGNHAANQKAVDAHLAVADKAGDASAVGAANLAAAELVPVSQQWFVGQFWGDPAAAGCADRGDGMMAGAQAGSPIAARGDEPWRAWRVGVATGPA